MNNKQSMEKSNTSKRIKSQIVEKQDEENFPGPSEAMEVVQASTKNYFTPQIMDVWPQILGYVTDPNDVYSVMNSAPVFQSLLEKRKVTALLPLVLPVLMENECLEPRDILNCRLVLKSLKVGVDDALVEQQPDWVPKNTYRLAYDDGNNIQRLLDVSPDFTGNPFILRDASFTLEDVGDPQHFVNILQILHRFGHQLYRVDLTVKLYESPLTAMVVLKQALSYLPNIKRLQLIFDGCYLYDAIPWNNFRTSHRLLPVLQHLEYFDVDFMPDYADSLPPSSFVRPFLLAYRKQIKDLICESYVFRGVNWKPFRFQQLRQLMVHFETDVDSELISETFRNVAKLDCPQLEKLTLFRMGGGLIITTDAFEALDNFRNSLKELRLGDFEERCLPLFQVDPANIREFPQMTTLKLKAVNAGTELMRLFRVQFTKLEELHFKQPPWPWRYQPSLEKIRNDYFSIFPNLKRIFWKSGQKVVVLTRQMKL